MKHINIKQVGIFYPYIYPYKVCDKPGSKENLY
jgi:hypothetical protein